MSITSSLNAGVAGLNANAARLAAISDNIANSATFGYRRADTDFEAMVIGGTRGGYTAGGVRAMTDRVVDRGGALVGTSSPLDLAISGRGMLPVRDSASLTTGDTSLLLTPTGSFSRDAEGYIRTSSGLLLLGWPANRDGTMPTYPRDTVAGLQPVRVESTQRSADPTTAISLGVNLPAGATREGAAGDDLTLTLEYFGTLGNTEELTVTFTPDVPASGSSNSWTVTITDSGQGGVTIGEYTVSFSNSGATSGTVASVTTVSGAAYDPLTGTIALVASSGTIDLTLGRPGDPSGLTQFDSEFALVALEKNGSPMGSFLGLEVDDQGFLIASYDSGFTQRLYQIPLVDVPNQNGLAAVGRQAFQITPDSGPMMLWDAGTGPTGTIAGYSREASATDVAAELTALIQTQRAYASNAKVIQTVALSFALPTLLPVEISVCVLASPELMVFIVCSATMALVLVRIDVMSVSLCERRVSRRCRKVSARAEGHHPPRHPVSGCSAIWRGRGLNLSFLAQARPYRKS